MDDLLLVDSLSLFASDDGELVGLQAEDAAKRRTRLAFSTENAPSLATALLQNFQAQLAKLSPEHLQKLAGLQEQIQLHNPIAAYDARATSAPGADEMALLVHLGGTFLHFRLPLAAAASLKAQLEEALDQTGWPAS